MINEKEILDNISKIRDADTDNFVELARIANLDPARHFSYSNWSDVDFSGCDLAGFDFTGSNLSNCNFSGANIEGATFIDAKIDGSNLKEVAASAGLNLTVSPTAPLSSNSFLYNRAERNQPRRHAPVSPRFAYVMAMAAMLALVIFAGAQNEFFFSERRADTPLKAHLQLRRVNLQAFARARNVPAESKQLVSKEQDKAKLHATSQPTFSDSDSLTSASNLGELYRQHISNVNLGDQRRHIYNGSSWGSGSPLPIRLSFMAGEVQIRPSQARAYGPATVNQPVTEGDQLWLPKGALLELQMKSGTYLRLDQDSAAQVLTATTENALQVSLTKGHAYVFYDAPEGGSIQLDTPKQSIKAFENAVFRVDLSEKIDTVGVLDGNVEVETVEGMKRVGRGQMLTFGEDGSVDVGPAGRPDDWENWNNQRNTLHAPEANDPSKQLLPKELETYLGDLSNGKWVETKEHGHAWKPQDVDDDWTPYDNGRWILYGGEYTWVGYESWGWAPYHYGRWAYVPSEGWLWVPPLAGDVYWAPGYVAWYESDGYIGWAPLWPGEYYYGHGYHGQHSVDIDGGDQLHRDYDRYRHFGDHRGMRVVSREHFIQHFGDRPHGYKYEKSTPQAFGDQTASTLKIGGPSVQDELSQHFASNRQISSDKAPPSHAANLQISDIKNTRSVATRPGQSSFSPGAKPAAMHTRTAHEHRSFAGSGQSVDNHYGLGDASNGAGFPMTNRLHGGNKWSSSANHSARSSSGHYSSGSSFGRRSSGRLGGGRRGTGGGSAFSRETRTFQSHGLVPLSPNQ